MSASYTQLRLFLPIAIRAPGTDVARAARAGAHAHQDGCPLEQKHPRRRVWHEANSSPRMGTHADVPTYHVERERGARNTIPIQCNTMPCQTTYFLLLESELSIFPCVGLDESGDVSRLCVMDGRSILICCGKEESSLRATLHGLMPVGVGIMLWWCTVCGGGGERVLSAVHEGVRDARALALSKTAVLQVRVPCVLDARRRVHESHPAMRCRRVSRVRRLGWIMIELKVDAHTRELLHQSRDAATVVVPTTSVDVGSVPHDERRRRSTVQGIQQLGRFVGAHGKLVEIVVDMLLSWGGRFYIRWDCWGSDTDSVLWQRQRRRSMRWTVASRLSASWCRTVPFDQCRGSSAPSAAETARGGLRCDL